MTIDARDIIVNRTEPRVDFRWDRNKHRFKFDINPQDALLARLLKGLALASKTHGSSRQTPSCPRLKAFYPKRQSYPNRSDCPNHKRRSGYKVTL